MNRPITPKQFPSSARPDIKKYAAPEEREANIPNHRDNRASLELYGGSGKVRTEQPAVRGSNIDITV